MTEYGNSFAAWRKATGAAWQDYVCHGFVTELGSGTLPKSAFFALSGSRLSVFDSFFAGVGACRYQG
jgi:hypothetical protein